MISLSNGFRQTGNDSAAVRALPLSPQAGIGEENRMEGFFFSVILDAKKSQIRN